MLFVVKSGCRDFASYLFRTDLFLQCCEVAKLQFTVYSLSYSLFFEISWFCDVVMSRFRGLSICSFALCRFGKCMTRRCGDFTALRFDIIVICRFGYFTPFWTCDSRFTYFHTCATLHFRYSWCSNLSEFGFWDFTCLFLSDFALLWIFEESFWQHCDFMIFAFLRLGIANVVYMTMRIRFAWQTDRYRKVESAYQCWQSGVDSQTSFTEHPAFRTLATLIGRFHFTILLKWSRCFQQMFFPPLWVLDDCIPPKKRVPRKQADLATERCNTPASRNKSND